MIKEERETNLCFEAADFERRKYARCSAALPLEYRRINSSKIRFGHIGNISESGLMASLPEEIEAGEKLRLKIFFSCGPGLNTIEATGRVVWGNKDMAKEGYYRYGFDFEEISPEDKERLKGFLGFFGDG
jgi:c-di-GMP-binding flagellar brake protein YcgR